jgi:benzoyl-CoA reductase subunit C
MQNSRRLGKIVEKCYDLAFDLEFRSAREWKKADRNRVLVGYMPVYFPREVVHAACGLAVGILGAGDRKQIIKGDAYYQSYICRLPRGVIELLLDKNLDDFDGFVFPSICDVIRNLSGMFRIIDGNRFAKYLDYPQNFLPSIGGQFYVNELSQILELIHNINGIEVLTEKLNASIRLYNHNRKLIEDIYDLRQRFPWRISQEDLYYILRAGLVITVEVHNQILEDVYECLLEDTGEPMDKIRVIAIGAFCEQPPVGLIKTIEMSGCYIVDDDFLAGLRWIEGDINADSENPLQAIADAYINRSRLSSTVFSFKSTKGKRIVELARKRNADGVIFCAPSFCDPSLLDQPMLQAACDEAGLRYINFQYSENTGQFKVIKEQVGAFSDSIKLWEEPEMSF